MKTSELIGAQLDWAVAKCEGALAPTGNVLLIGKQLFIAIGNDTSDKMEYSPSTDWAQGGPIIESFQNNESTFCLFFNPYKDHPEYGNSRPWKAEYKGRSFYAETPLIASMRCFVASRLGDEIDIPEELK